MAVQLNDFLKEISENFELLKVKYPIFLVLDTISEDNSSHKNYSVYRHTERVFKNALFFYDLFSDYFERQKLFSKREKDIFLLGVLLHDIGKINTGVYIKGEKQFPSHEQRGSDMAEILLNDFDVTEDEKVLIVSFIKNHTEIQICLDGEVKNFDNNLLAFKKKHARYLDFILFCLADIYGSYLEVSNKDEYLYRINTLIGTIQHAVISS